MRCPRCEHDNPASVKFCGECGARLEATCPACGASNPLSNKFCHQCGLALSGGSGAGTHRAAPECPGRGEPNEIVAEAGTQNAASWHRTSRRFRSP